MKNYRKHDIDIGNDPPLRKRFQKWLFARRISTSIFFQAFHLNELQVLCCMLIGFQDGSGVTTLTVVLENVLETDGWYGDVAKTTLSNIPV